jgi:hypothetical protein
MRAAPLDISTGYLLSAARYSLILLLLFVAIPRLSADDLTELQVKEVDGIYHIRMVMVVHVPAKYVRGVLTDYAHIYRLNPSITESEILPSPEQGVVRVRTLMHGCVAFFCKDVGRVEDVRELKSGDLQAVIVPELSNLRSGAAEWKIQPMGDYTQVTYQGHMEPDFFVPPVIGSYFVKRNMRREITVSFMRLECVAQIQARLDTLPRLQFTSLDSDIICGDRCDSNSIDCQQ